MATKKTKKAKAKAKAAKKPAAKRGGRQQELPGTAPKRHADLDEAAVLAPDAARAFTAAGKRRAERYAVVDGLLAKHNLEHYVTPDRLICDVNGKRRVTVRPADE